jgi:DNA-binding XRE family transcriptional regulator
MGETSEQTLEERVAELERTVALLQARASAGDRMRQLNAEKRGDPVLIGGGAMLRAARKRVGWSQPQLAFALSVRKQTFCRWEADQTALVRWRAQQIVDLFRREQHEPPAWPLDGWTLDVDLYVTDDDSEQG